MLPTFNQFIFSLLLLWFALNLLLLVHAQDDQSAGFISIDCGKSGSSYTEKVTGITYISDSNFVDTGESNFILDKYLDAYQQPYQSLRSFPQGIRNCYKINIRSGTKYLIRAVFVYGNYDGQDKLPKFDLYVGPNLWDSVKLMNASIGVTKELIHYVPRPRNYIQLCLVNKLSGIPFISAIELRPLPNSTYSTEEGSLALVSRFDTGQIAPTLTKYRYPFDILDRFWYPYDSDWNNWTQLSASTNTSSAFMPSTRSGTDSDYKLPFVVMNTAATPRNRNGALNNFWPPEAKNGQYYIYLHLAEVERLQSMCNQSRQFKMTMYGRLLFGPYVPQYYMSETFYNRKALSGGQENFTISMTGNATLPPILNAFEIYMLKKFSESETNQEDVSTITRIKSTYKIITNNWQGDPCAPQHYSWEGLNCSYQESDESPRIISLHLPWSGLQGEITPSIFKLAMIQSLNLSNNNLTGPIPKVLSQLPNLVFLDLSNNKLTGRIPDIFSQMPKLNILNLENNKLTGSIPEGLIRRMNSGFLSLRLCENPNLLGNVTCKNKKKNFLLPIAISIVGVSILFSILAFIWWSCVRKRKHNAKANIQLGSVESAKRKFAHSEIVKMTNNFQRILGKGGFGTVYHGHKDNTQVAIKMLSPSSVQGFQQFHAEVDLLIRVHHKNLTSLVGYCNDETNLGLVYEFMANGNLQEQLSDSSSRILSWEHRLRIAVDAAQGLEYLHYGIKPPIIHRDVKSANILLDDNFEAKVSDFGLSRNFPADAGTHISTAVAGTTGYLDPEYYLSNRLNEKSDVYSFGIVLLEIITGRPAVLSTTDERIHISQWVGFMLVSGDISSIVDPRLDGNFTVNSVWKAVEIAMACASPNAIKRPTMSQVVMELKECMATQMGETNHNNKTKLTSSTELISNDSIPMLSPPSVR
ncbi:probable LRR receptor-like serine/threonine-protein kinase At1g51880 isoform X1 [Rosa chinensis]|uniref:probable LRR receptor-like serine/threonine-protein kinase At1g51880 isoform X1 n=1 Tax=Rosa chinensis TaxID=74649 RepID=UPI000D0877C0|nr:probable LRR receptor-like serine/threonine-protein kinase At1g51880 isoform X1 [Rosa chinensis]